MMNSAAVRVKQMPPAASGQALQPNELDLRRIVRLLEKRARYRYVMPVVDTCENGYRIQSPCCSRNIDAAGGIIDIAWLEYDALLDVWKLYRKDHMVGSWQFHVLAQRLGEVMDCLSRDPARVFWQ
jgi:hypothetical protein